MAKLFFLLSGEHPTLPFSEVKAILKAEGCKYRVLESLTQVFRVETDEKCVKPISSRAALTRICGIELFNCNADLAEIVKNMQNIPLEKFLRPKQSFKVRVRRVKGTSPHLARVELERKLGELILNKVERAKVNLTSPEKTFLGILTQKRFIFGLKTAEISPKPFMERRPRKKVFFHPSAMQAKLARCMVNLAQPKRGDLLFDPFCGTASILIEAALIGCRIIGLDVKRRMVKGSIQNLSQYGIKPEGILVADARFPPLTKVDCVVTDPPYGRSATTLGFGTRQIVEDTLTAVEDILPKGRRICVATPKTVDVRKIAQTMNFQHIESHFVYVHRSLTREVTVLEKQ